MYITCREEPMQPLRYSEESKLEGIPFSPLENG